MKTLTLSILLISLIFAGCFSLVPSKGKLSDRMNEAADTTSSTSTPTRTRGDRERDRREAYASRETEDLGVRIVAELIDLELHRQAEEACMCVVEKPKPVRATPSALDSIQTWITASGGDGAVSGPQTRGYPHGALGVAFSKDGTSQFTIEVNAGSSAASPNAKLSRSINGISDLFADASVRYFLTPAHTFLGVYFFGGLGYGLQWWDYRDGGSDAVDGIDVFGGVGFNFVQTKHVQLGLEARPGFIIWMPKTMQGYDNDVFGSMGYIKIGPTLSVRF